MLRCFRTAALLALVGLGVCTSGIVSASAQSGRGGEGEEDGEQRLVVVGARMAGDDNRVRIVLEFQQDPDYAIRYLAAPYRAVIDLPQTVFAFEQPSLGSRGLVSSVRYGSAGEGRARIVFELASPARLEPFEDGGETSGPLHRLVFDAVAIESEEFLSQVDETVWTPLGTEDDRAPGSTAEETLNIMIDPGHGGIDGGAEGPTGTLEKSVTLAFAEAFRKALSELDDVRVSLTRTDDTFLSLSARVRKAREEDADLLVSLHADSIRIKSLRGATVYTLSDRASDAIAQALAEKENAAEEIVGVKLDNAPEDVASILVDLARNETRIFSNGLARQVIDSFEGQVRLINNPLRHAGFQVLQAPDVPSVLIELGYLSNREDEKMLTDPAWQEKTAELLAQSVVKYRQSILAGRK
ncbi:N-acetylmuramoyl-L-alanine amidase [Hoeflea sp.]|uniref:N-acetylmuramoyl-L-alanine amidase n=1 Tax=Hoeflea sp. TaxID=1940281 RepID=UPI003BAE2A74